MLSTSWIKMLEIQTINVTMVKGDSMTNFHCLSASFPPQTNILCKKPLTVCIPKETRCDEGRKQISA